MSTKPKNPPARGQIVRWIEPEEYRNPDFVKAKREQYPGELRVVSIIRDPRFNKGHFFLTISHNGEKIPNPLYADISADFAPFWFHWDNE